MPVLVVGDLRILEMTEDETGRVIPLDLFVKKKPCVRRRPSLSQPTPSSTANADTRETTGMRACSHLEELADAPFFLLFGRTEAFFLSV